MTGDIVRARGFCSLAVVWAEQRSSVVRERRSNIKQPSRVISSQKKKKNIITIIGSIH